MKTQTYFFSLFLALLFVTLSCNEDDGPGIPPPSEMTPPTSADFLNLSSTALDNLTQTFDFNIDGGTTYLEFISEQGVSVRIYTSCLTMGGQPLTGDVDVEFVELYKRGNLMTTNIATMGMHANGDLEMLVTGGAFYINVLQNGIEIDNVACGIQMNVPTALTGGVDHDMIMWYGNMDAEGNLVWEEAEEGDGGQGAGIEITNDTYYTFLNQFGWANVDRFYNDPRPKTTILVDVPEGYDQNNSSVYLSYDGEDYGLARLDTWVNGMFSEHYGQIPIGLEVHVIFISEFEGSWVYAIKPVTIAGGEVITISAEDLAAATEDGIANHINTLP
jgi:hypothetical protein